MKTRARKIKLQFFSSSHFFRNRRAMTLIEILLTISIVSILSVALYKSLDNGLKVWKRSQGLVIEEDIMIFFEKLVHDLRNSFFYSSLLFEGDGSRLSFPSIVDVPQDTKSDKGSDLAEQIGRVEYSFDAAKNTIYRRKANYSQALDGKFFDAQTLVSNIDDVKFQYVYLTDQGEVKSSKVLDFLPFAVEVEVKFLDKQGTHVMRKNINVPAGS